LHRPRRRIEAGPPKAGNDNAAGRPCRHGSSLLTSKITVQIRNSNTSAIDFYRAIGFAVDEVVSMGKRLEDDGPAA